MKQKQVNDNICLREGRDEEISGISEYSLLASSLQKQILKKAIRIKSIPDATVSNRRTRNFYKIMCHNRNIVLSEYQNFT